MSEVCHQLVLQPERLGDLRVGRAAGRPGTVHGVDGLGELQDLVGELQQLLVLLVFFLDGLPLVVGQDLAFSSARFWLIITKVDRKIASSDTIMVNSP